jgi:hypothetical protein
MRFTPPCLRDLARQRFEVPWHGTCSLLRKVTVNRHLPA